MLSPPYWIFAENFPKAGRIRKSFLVLLGCPSGRYYLGTILTECTGIFTAFSPSCYAVLMSSKESETAVYGCNPALLKFYQCRVDVLQSLFLRRQISLAVMFVMLADTPGVMAPSIPSVTIPPGHLSGIF